ncbi:MAG: hypothetical protein NZ853_02475 [Leptospiraceae bacterium]|nr:hypothetical protein [Leptospiraceae bacterium]MDW7975045.1 hypothetical protein [Leptospiraceae bacterium]
MKTKIHLIIFIFIFIVLAFCKEKGVNIETIGKDSITTQDFETYYETYIEKASRLANAEKKTLYELMCNPERIPQDPAIQELIMGLYPENAYQKFREMKIVEQAAKLEKFDQKPVIKNIIEQVRLETLVNLYIQEKMQEKIKISQEQVERKCEELRKKDPRILNLSIDDCLKISEAYLKNEIIRAEYPRLINEIKESVQVKKNNEFNREQYLRNEIKLFKEAQEIGKCPKPEKQG